MLVEMRKCLIRTFCQMEMRSVPVGKRRYRLRGIEGHHRPVSARYDKSRYGTNPQLRRLMPNGELYVNGTGKKTRVGLIVVSEELCFFSFYTGWCCCCLLLDLFCVFLVAMLT